MASIFVSISIVAKRFPTSSTLSSLHKRRPEHLSGLCIHANESPKTSPMGMPRNPGRYYFSQVSIEWKTAGKVGRIGESISHPLMPSLTSD